MSADDKLIKNKLAGDFVPFSQLMTVKVMVFPTIPETMMTK